MPARGKQQTRDTYMLHAHRSDLAKTRGNQGHQSYLTSACIACWSLGRFVLVFAFEVGLVESHSGVVSSTFVVAFEHTLF